MYFISGRQEDKMNISNNGRQITMNIEELIRITYGIAEEWGSQIELLKGKIYQDTS